MFNLILWRSVRHLRIPCTASPLCRPFVLSFSSSSLTPKKSLSTSPNEHSFTVNYLINSCGFSPKSAISASKYLNLKNTEQPDSVLAFFKNHGFTNTQILYVIKSYPRLLSCNPEKSLLPKLEFCSSIGLPRTEIAGVFVAAPSLMRHSLENRIIPSYNIVKGVLQSDERTISAIKRCPGLLTHDLKVSIIQNIESMRDVGVPESKILRYITCHPSALRITTDRFRRIVEEVKRMGFNPLTPNFIWAFHALGSMSKSTWEKKVEIYKRWGWSEDDILVAFGKRPWCMKVSANKVMRVMDFLVNKMGWKSSSLVNRPQLLSCSLEKKIIPRSLFYQALLDKGLIEKEMDRSWLVVAENVFINKIKKLYKEEAPQLLKLYHAQLNPLK